MSSDLVKEFPLEEEYKKKTLVTPEDITKLRAWLETQPHLPGKYFTDMDLILTYHSCNRSAEVAKQVLDLHFTLRTIFTNFFKDRVVDDDDKMMKIMNYYLVLPLEMRAHDGSKVLYCRIMDYNEKIFLFHEAVRTLFITMDLWQYMEGTWPGVVLILDFDKVTLGHIARLGADLQTVQQFFYFLQEAMLVKIKGLHFMSAPSFMDKVMLIFRPFMKKELLDMLVFHQVGARTMEKYLPMEGLPKEAGGEYMSLKEAQELVNSKVRVSGDFYKYEANKRVNESARPGKPKTITDIFGGIEGSFKKLDID